MRDDYLTADWANGQTRLSETIERAADRLRRGFATLQHHRFDAPWRHDVSSVHGRQRTRPAAPRRS